jgi:hypothetical protein
MRLLFEDMLDRRYRWPSALCVLGVAVFWLGADPRESFVASLTAVFAMGPLFVAAAPEPRAVWYVPVSRRDRWRATWLLAVAVPATIVTAAKLPVLLFSPPAHWLHLSGALALSGLLDFAYAGVACSLLLFLAEWRTTPGRGRALVPGLVSIVALITVMGGGLFWPSLFRRLLPLRWADLSPVSGTILAAALVGSVASYFHAPVPPPLGRGIRPSARPRTRERGSQVPAAGGLTRLPRLLLHEYRFSLGLGGFLVATCALVLFIAGQVTHYPDSLGGLLRLQSLLLFDAPVIRPRGPFDLIVWYALVAMTFVGRFPEILTHLRALPVAAWRLNLILVAWPALMLATVWTALLALHFAVLARPVESFQLPLLLALAGSCATLRAATLRWPGVASWIVGLTLIVTPLVRLADGRPHPWLTGLGLAGIAASAVVNHFTLRRASTYKRAAAAVGGVPARSWS